MTDENISVDEMKNRYEVLPNVNVKAIVGSNPVIQSGTILSHGNDDIILMPFFSEQNRYSVIVKFRDGEGKGSVDAKIVGSNYEITFINAKSKSGTINPIYCANHAGRKILVDLAFDEIGSGERANRILYYTFIDGGPING